MLTLYIISHYFFPQESNNNKPQLLQASSIFLFIALFIILQTSLYLIPKTGLRVLGYASNISVEEVVRLTNEKRAQSGLAPLTLNSTLSNAARMKGEDMINKDYWAHVSPDGTQPWRFFTDAGYQYRYAGENLARDFSNPSSAVDAWMASPTHKDNLLSSKYHEIGIAVLEGDLAGVDTTLIVQLFGTSLSATAEVGVPVAHAEEVTQELPAASEEVEEVVVVETKPVALAEAKELPNPTQIPLLALANPPSTAGQSAVSSLTRISPFNATRNISIVVVGLLIMVFVIDGVLVAKRRIPRVAGRTFAHISFLGMILAIALILRAGRIL
ncbi:CAP domain-containing protein [Patescibacteria group bacterium]